MSYFERPPAAPHGPQTETVQVQPPQTPPEPQTETLQVPPPETAPEAEPDPLHADQTGQDEPSSSPGSRVRGLRDRVTQALHNFDRPRPIHASPDPAAAPSTVFDAQAQEPDAVVDEVPPASQDARFPVGPLGYNRAAVDVRMAELERELEEARSGAPIPITDEIERLGEQTASILVVAHDQAHETTRAAQEQADRCIADAAANAVAMTEQAKRKLHELDNETDAIWRERARLLDDAREVGLALIAMAEEALERFPEEALERFPEEAKGEAAPPPSPPEPPVA